LLYIRAIKTYKVDAQKKAMLRGSFSHITMVCEGVIMTWLEKNAAGDFISSPSKNMETNTPTFEVKISHR